ncbi:MAG: TonB-dependent receptor [Schleiferiaceae bacterium]|nr:TonB-dependent receptor [Schleiferiaceae bacterium]
MRQVLTAILSLAVFQIIAQTGIIKGRVSDALNNESIPFAVVSIEGTSLIAETDLDGNYKFEGISPGLYNLTAQSAGYSNKTVYEIQVNPSRPMEVNFKMSGEQEKLDEVVLVAQTTFERDEESPVSLKKIGINEIQRNPGGNQDISKVIQALPGVASSVSFRNDLIIRGGAPNENRFYLDGIEIPAINHFATQGASGGPVGMINVNTIREVDFYTGAFPSNRGNTMSSVMDINLKNGRDDRVGGLFQVGASEVGLFLEGPLSKKATFMVSARQSYLQFLFSALELPFLPTYNDFQFKVKYNIDEKNQLTFLGLGAIDNFKLNLDANETEEQQYLLNNLVDNDQWNYSIGAKYTRFRKKGFTTFVLSRFMFNNTAVKYRDNNENNELLLDYNSQEISNKFRVEDTYQSGPWKFVYGAGLEQNKYNTSTFDKRLPSGLVLNYKSDLNLVSYALFGNVQRTFFENRLSANVGLRMDAINFSSTTNNPLDQFSPRVALSYNVTDMFSINANWGIYYQLPPYTTLGFRDENGTLINEGLKYIRSEHFVLGVAQVFSKIKGRLAVEGFLKNYSQYPFIFPEMISLANLGSDFEVIGNRPATSTNNGKAYGLEISYEQKLYEGFYGIGAITLVRSEFDGNIYDANGNVSTGPIPSRWDNGLIVPLTAGKKFGTNWEIGMQYQYLGGAPYTPYDIAQSSLISNWDNIGRGILDYTQLNTQRFSGFNRLNLRVDKKWFFSRYSLDVYLDVQNLLGETIEGQPFLDTQKDANGNPIVDPNDPTRYLMKPIANSQGTTLPTIGIIFEF